MDPGTLNFTIYQGANESRTFTWVDEVGSAIDLTGCTARMQLRETFDSTVLLELTTTNGRLAISTGTDGKITMALTAAQTTALTFSSAKYDLEVVFPSGYVYRLLMGTITLDKEVTK